MPSAHHAVWLCASQPLFERKPPTSFFFNMRLAASVLALFDQNFDHDYLCNPLYSERLGQQRMIGHA